MPETTNIQWCDSTHNLQMGCEGCELSSKTNDGKPRCYAEVMTNRYQGLKGWPETFMKPKLFLDRLPKMLHWSDLTAKERPNKPWLNGLPRIIFLNDMGDTFSGGMPADWFADVMPQLASSSHQYLVLTKWPQRFLEFERRHPLPNNIWPGTSVTNGKTLFRAKQLAQIKTGGPLWISAEPHCGYIDWHKFEDIQRFKWIIFGGESGANAEQCLLNNILLGISVCLKNNVAPFVKQLGARPAYFKDVFLKLRDGHGGDWNEWPAELKIREMPKI